MAISKSDFLAASVPDVAPIYSYTAEIDTTPAGNARTWAALCAGINNLSEALNETIQQYYFLCGHGFAANYVTGLAPAFTLTGVRVVGDAAQEYIFGKKYATMGERSTNMRLTRTDADGETEVVSAHVTFVNLSEISGATTDGSAISIELRINGEPYIGDAWAS